MKDITLPSDLCSCGLTLEEIGSIFVTFAYNSLEQRHKALWATNKDYKSVTQNMVERQILEVDDGEYLLDITKLVEEPFWKEDTIDLDGNQSYYHLGYLEGDYRIYPMLKNNEIWFILAHSENGQLGEFKTMKEAETFVVYALNDEWEYIISDK